MPFVTGSINVNVINVNVNVFNVNVIESEHISDRCFPIRSPLFCVSHGLKMRVGIGVVLSLIIGSFVTL